MAAYEEAGLHPFTRNPLMAAHIASSKGKTVKTRTLNYDAIDYDKPVKPQVACQLGPGGRMTTGKICDFPLTHENNIKLFEALDAEKKLKLDGAAARKRIKAGTAKEGDEDLAQQLSELEGGEFVAKLKAAREREAACTVTKGDANFLKTRKAQAATAGENDAAIPPPTEPPQKKKRASKKDAESDGDDSDGSDDSEEEDDGKDLLKKKWMDEELDAECTVTRRTRFQGQRALWYTHVDGKE